MFSRWKMKNCLSGTWDFCFFFFFVFLHKAELAVIPTRSKKNKTEQHLGHFPTKNRTKQNKTPKNMPSTIHVFDWEEKVQHSLDSDVTTRRRGIHFETLVLCTFLYTFMYTSDLAKLCSDKLCKSAFQKNLANNNNPQKKEEKKKEEGRTRRQNEQSGHSTQRYWNELHLGSSSYSQNGT